jgi:pimeloyl-ACP methyl ester carboxylesterase
MLNNAARRPLLLAVLLTVPVLAAARRQTAVPPPGTFAGGDIHPLSQYLTGHLRAGHLQARTTAAMLPAPTGPHAVGTTEWHVTDATRAETFAPGTKRHVHVIAYYPAAKKTGARTPYLREGLAEATAFATLLRVPSDTFNRLADIETHAWTDAPVLADGRKMPVLMFSHGYTAHASAYAALLEDLASHGYAVLSVVHPFEAVAARQPDGTVVTVLDDGGAMRPDIRDVLAEWGSEDKVAASITNAGTEATQLKLVREYLAGLQHTSKALDRWIADFRIVNDDLRRRRTRAAPRWLVDRLGLERIGVFGHSMGGVSGAAFCVSERRCAAAANLDGSPQYGRMIDQRLGRPLMMVYSGRPGRERTNDAVYVRAASKYYKVSFAGTKHLEFSDMPLWGGPLRERGAFGSIDPVRAAELTRIVTREFFDQELRSKPSAVLGTRRPFPEVTVVPPR